MWWNTHAERGRNIGGKHSAGRTGKHGGLALKRQRRKQVKAARKQARRERAK